MIRVLHQASPLWKAVKVGSTARCDRHVDSVAEFEIMACADCMEKAVNRTVEELKRAEGTPRLCSSCGGELAPAFGQRVEDDGTIRPVLDPTALICRDCGTLFKR